MKKFVLGFLIGLISTFSISAFAAVELKVIPNPIPIFVDGVKSDIPGYNINGLTFLQLSAFKKMGLGVVYNTEKKEIYITSAAPQVQQNISGGSTMQYDSTTGLPVGAIYIDNEKDGKAYKTIQYNSKIFISTSDLEQVFGIKSLGVDVKSEQGIYEKDGTKIYLDLHNPDTVFFVGGFLYVPVTTFEQYMN